MNGQNLGSLVYYESQHKFLASYGKWDRHTSSRPYMDVTVDFLLDDGSTPQGLRGVTGFTDLDGGTSAMIWYKGKYIMRSSNPALTAGRTLPNAFVYAGN